MLSKESARDLDSPPFSVENQRKEISAPMAATAKSATSQVPDPAGRFGDFGGRYVPETLIRALDELAVDYDKACQDAAFQSELADLLKHYVGRPSPLYFAKRLSEHCGGA